MTLQRFLLVAAVAGAALPLIASGDAPAAAPGSADKAAPAAGQAENKPHDNRCLTDTGSHIKPVRADCLPVAGHSYDSEELESTGAATTSQALRKVDPTVGGGR